MKKRIFTWIKPTSSQIHLGNYFWAIKPVLDLQNSWDYEVIVFVADLHALTTLHDWEAIRQNTINLVRAFIASGLDPEKVLIFKQSDVPAHTQLNWVLACITHLGYMKRMHAYKDALQKGKTDEITMWTFNYPILMAADILLYDPDLVPVWKDQKQHLEFTRDIAEKFNRLFWETFKLPEPFIREDVATVPGIDGRKMSKSYNNYIWIFEDEKTLLKKVRSIVTNNIPIEEPKNPDECNVYNILKLFLTEKEDEEIRQKYLQWWLAYKDVKMYLYEKLLWFLKPIQEKAKSLSDNDIKKILEKGGQKANEIAEKKIKDVYGKVWFIF